MLAFGINRDFPLWRIETDFAGRDGLTNIRDLGGSVRLLDHLFVKIDGQVGVFAFLIDIWFVREFCSPAFDKIFAFRSVDFFDIVSRYVHVGQCWRFEALMLISLTNIDRTGHRQLQGTSSW